ncbi:MAG: acyltransferase family protein [Candidatus Ornithomonoglobus sp.]
MKKIEKRELWIDLLRAMAMFFVVMGHVYKGNPLYFMLTGPVKMPLFYILSGYTFKTDKRFGEFVKSSAYRLGIPWIIFSLFPIKLARYVFRVDAGGALEYTLDFITGNVEWFITSFFITQLLVLILHKLIKEREWLVWIVSVGLFAAGVAAAPLGINKLWSMGTALTGVLFFNIGFYMRKHIHLINEHKNILLLSAGGIFAILICVSWILFPYHSMDFHNASYYNVPLCLALCLSGAVMLVCAAKSIRECSLVKWIAVFGQNTLVVYLFHPTLISVLRKIFGTGIFPRQNVPFVNALCMSVLICIIGTIISCICGRVIPWSVGKKADRFISLKGALYGKKTKIE